MLRTLRSYVFWSHERGSMHYDVMVTLILLFIFVTPRFINYHDRPKYQLPSQIMVENDGSGELIYQVRAADVINSEHGGRDGAAAPCAASSSPSRATCTSSGIKL